MTQLRNNESQFGLVSVILHWVAAIILITMLCAGITYMALPDGDPAAGPYIRFHIMLGYLLWAVVLIRVIWHFMEQRPKLLGASPVENRISRFWHRAMLALVTIQLVTGPLSVGGDLQVFGLYTMPSMVRLLGISEGLEGIFETIHGISGFLLALMVLVHIAGALKHAFIDKDGTLHRIFGIQPPQN